MLIFCFSKFNFYGKLNYLGFNLEYVTNTRNCYKDGPSHCCWEDPGSSALPTPAKHVSHHKMLARFKLDVMHASVGDDVTCVGDVLITWGHSLTLPYTPG